ncbi:MAG: tetratricopeptide repeat protein [Planctomycetota bacterium]|jgi:tetratricopeptide (TPR) repeat protein
MNQPLHKNSRVLISVLLVLVTVAVYWPVLRYDFVKYDDDKYLTENPRIEAGITSESVIDAFIKPHYSMWHPLTTLSYLLDYELFGFSASWFHGVSLLFHICCVVLLFLVLQWATGAIWPSAFVAAIFALHPLQVESVAWIAERKNVLSGFFSLLTIGAYVLYARRPCIARYLLVFFVFGLCIMTKPMVVTMPFVLLLLDYWPLERLTGKSRITDVLVSSGRLIAEKIPLFLLVGVLSVITFAAQKGGGVMSGFEKLSLNARTANALNSYVMYIAKMLWPSNLAVFYPHPGGNYSVARVVVYAVLLVVLTIVLVFILYRRKYLAVGWFWYAGTLIPVIGLVQVGAQARADRYMYISMIGLLFIVAWTARELAQRWAGLRIVTSIIAVVIVAASAVATRKQLSHWKDSAALFGHAVAATSNNSVMHNNLANELNKQGKTDEAIRHFERSLQIKPNSSEVHNNLGNALTRLGRNDRAIDHYKEAIRLKPEFAVAHYNLGLTFYRNKRFGDAISAYRQAVELKPNYTDAWNNLGMAQADFGDFEHAVESYRQAIEIKPDFVVAHGRLGLALAKLNRIDEAIEQFELVLQARPDDYEMHFNIGFLFESSGKGQKAIDHYRRSLQINPEHQKARQGLERLEAK